MVNKNPLVCRISSAQNPHIGSATEEVPIAVWGETPDLTIYEVPFEGFYHK